MNEKVNYSHGIHISEDLRIKCTQIGTQGSLQTLLTLSLQHLSRTYLVLDWKREKSNSIGRVSTGIKHCTVCGAVFNSCNNSKKQVL